MKTQPCPQCGREVIIGNDIETWDKVPLDVDAPVYYVAGNKNDEYLVKRHGASFVAHSETCADPSGFQRKDIKQVGLEVYQGD